MTSPPVEQELVAHVFAPLDGPNAAAAAEQIGLVWEACRTDLGMTQPIVGAGLTGDLPSDARSAPEGALAGLQDPAVNFQAIVRREHDVLNFSLVMAAPDAPPRRRRAIGAAAPPGWYEQDRWWHKLTAGGLGAMLGVATILQGKATAGEWAGALRAVPPRDDDADGWRTRAATVAGLRFWEVTPRGDRAGRRFVVLADPEDDARLSRFTWSDRSVALPPLGRYLLHAAKLRYQSRVRGDGGHLARVRERAGTGLDRLAGLLRDPSAAAEIVAARLTVVADTAEILGVRQALSAMRETVEIAGANMAAALPEPLPSDAGSAALLTRQLDNDTRLFEQARSRAVDTLQLVSEPVPPPVAAAVPVPPVEPPRPRDGRVEQRLGFGVDVVRYSGRSAPQQAEVQRRVGALVEQVLADAGVSLRDTDRQNAGDGMMVVLPAALELHRVVPLLLHGWRSRLAADNAGHPGDRIRMRLSIATGPFANAAIGFAGGTIIELGRLLDSDILRAAVVDHPVADVVALISDRVYADVVGEGWPGLDRAEFERFEVRVKEYERSAWLWMGVAFPAETRTPEPEAPAAERTSGRDVYVIHGKDERAHAAMFGFLRTIGLRPLEYEELVARTGNAAPSPAEVLDRGFAGNQAAIVLLTAADAADSGVLVPAGMALARQPDRTIIVTLGGVPEFPGLTGHAAVHLDGVDPTALHRLAQRLRNLGCAVHTDGTDWLDPGGFSGL